MAHLAVALGPGWQSQMAAIRFGEHLATKPVGAVTARAVLLVKRLGLGDAGGEQQTR